MGQFVRCRAYTEKEKEIAQVSVLQRHEESISDDNKQSEGKESEGATMSSSNEVVGIPVQFRSL